MADVTGEIYKKHHDAGARYGFTITGDVRGDWFKREIDSVARSLGKRELAVLDIGCRDGTLTQKYAAGHAVIGLDVDDEAVSRANRLPNMKAQKIDLNNEAIPLADASMDLVVAGEVIEHLQWPTEVVREIRRVLKPGGTFMGSVPNAFRLRNRLAFLVGREFEVDPTHLRQFSPTAMQKLLADFDGVSLDFIGGRRRDLHPRLFATQMHWVARRGA